jgi:L-arabinose isomerase
MIDLKRYELFVTGSQHLYGPKTLETVAEHSREIAAALGASAHLPVQVVFKPVLTTPNAIRELCLEANSTSNCLGLITWMHTFSPAKMWIAGLSLLTKPFLHLHTQYGREIPWSTIDMDFMNLNQSAHGDREFGFIGSRMRLRRKVVVGHWQEDEVQREIGVWVRAACAWADWQGARIARFGDNMRDVAVTEGDKVEAQIRFGYDVYGYGVGDLVKAVSEASESDVKDMTQAYLDEYDVVPALQPGVIDMPPLLKARVSSRYAWLSTRATSKPSPPPLKTCTGWFNYLPGCSTTHVAMAMASARRATGKHLHWYVP